MGSRSANAGLAQEFNRDFSISEFAAFSVVSCIRCLCDDCLCDARLRYE
jgi:hypothetical protein